MKPLDRRSMSRDAEQSVIVRGVAGAGIPTPQRPILVPLIGWVPTHPRRYP
jgi:hypothetical protein